LSIFSLISLIPQNQGPIAAAYANQKQGKPGAELKIKKNKHKNAIFTALKTHLNRQGITKNKERQKKNRLGSGEPFCVSVRQKFRQIEGFSVIRMSTLI
jgi:hypothetical protein